MSIIGNNYSLFRDKNHTKTAPYQENKEEYQ